jgi:putative membrane protein
MEETSLSLVLNGLSSGLPLLLLHFGATVALFSLGVVAYVALTPFHERRLLASGNPAAGIVLGGTLVAIAIPLAATLATSLVLLDILVWGAIAVALQLATFFVAVLFFRDLRPMIESGNVAAGTTLAALQLAVALMNAGAMAG